MRATSRLTDSASCLVVGDFDMGAQMRRIMEAAGQPVPESKPSSRINPGHPLVKCLTRRRTRTVLPIWAACYSTRPTWPRAASSMTLRRTCGATEQAVANGQGLTASRG